MEIWAQLLHSVIRCVRERERKKKARLLIQRVPRILVLEIRVTVKWRKVKINKIMGAS